MQGMYQALKSLPSQLGPSTQIVVPKDFYVPSYWTVLAAYAHREKLKREQIEFHADVAGYASAMGWSQALWQQDDYAYRRVKKGQNYSPLVHLSHSSHTDAVVEDINNCIRNFCDGVVPENFVLALCHVVGDLHDNVWSHGMDSGFSMAQKWKVPHCDDYYLEFSIADHGVGFLWELQRAKIPVQDDAAAIEWCLQEGNSTKKVPVDADWIQALPGDIFINPLAGIEETLPADKVHNHHQGLGLYNLLKTVELFGGDLYIASGSCYQEIVPGRPKKAML
jgi:hypothetical protein